MSKLTECLHSAVEYIGVAQNTIRKYRLFKVSDFYNFLKKTAEPVNRAHLRELSAPPSSFHRGCP